MGVVGWWWRRRLNLHSQLELLLLVIDSSSGEKKEEKGGKVTCLTGVCVCSHYLTTEVTLFVEELLAKGS